MSNPIEDLLKRLINDPALLKNLEKMATLSVKESLKEKERKRTLDRFGSLDYLNKVIKQCKLCGSTSTFYSPMIWDKLDKLHRASCMSGIIVEEWASLEVRTLRQYVPTCNCCADVLKNSSKDDLIRRLMIFANRV